MPSPQPDNTKAASLSPTFWVLVVIAITINLRPFLSAPGPLGPVIQNATGMDLRAFSWLTLLPMALMGIGGWLAPTALRRWGARAAICASLLLIALGLGMKEGGMDENAMISTLLGVSFVGAFLVCFSAWLLPYLKKVITPTVSGVVVMMIGLSLVHVGITDFGGGFGAALHHR